MRQNPTRRAVLLTLGFLALTPLLAAALETPAVTKIRPGEIWNDTGGKPINAHGGGILFHEGTYYWYGEMNEGKTYLPEVNKS